MEQITNIDRLHLIYYPCITENFHSPYGEWKILER
ncbi:hypothetical protein IAD21_05689 [Abditibacteriota bacterium]|nr:hypothetical protein IAD21_05689 [Abditibacteriota bacterium]